MAEYIERGKAMEMRFTDGINEDSVLYVPYRDVASHLKSLPAADVVEVVRCKDCKHRPISEKRATQGFGVYPPRREQNDILTDDWECPCLGDDSWCSWMPEDEFFCAYGERKDVNG